MTYYYGLGDVPKKRQHAVPTGRRFALPRRGDGHPRLCGYSVHSLPFAPATAVRRLDLMPEEPIYLRNTRAAAAAPTYAPAPCRPAATRSAAVCTTHGQ